MIIGSVQINKGYYFIVFNMYDEHGKRKPEWHSTSGLKVDNNERKNNQNRKQAEKILNEENQVIELYQCLILLLIY